MSKMSEVNMSEGLIETIKSEEVVTTEDAALRVSDKAVRLDLYEISYCPIGYQHPLCHAAIPRLQFYLRSHRLESMYHACFPDSL